jgi:hypothetical protein
VTSFIKGRSLVVAAQAAAGKALLDRLEVYSGGKFFVNENVLSNASVILVHSLLAFVGLVHVCWREYR